MTPAGEKSSTAEKSNLDFKNILTSLKYKFEIISCTWSEEKYFEIKFRTEMDRNSYDYNKLCDEWVDKFSNLTNTVWAKKTSNTGPKVKFRKQYQCWTHGGKEIKKEMLFDPKKCKGTLDVKVLSDVNPSSKRRNKFMRLGLNVVIKINFSHLHKVNLNNPCAFFVHDCEPQTEDLKQTLFVNERLPQVVSDKVQKEINAIVCPNEHKPGIMNSKNLIDSQIVNVMKFEELKQNQDIGELPMQICSPVPEVILGKNDTIQEDMHINSAPTFQLIHNIPMQNIKFEFQQGFEQFAQILVTDSNMNEPFICQPLVFDNLQSLPNFVQLNSHAMCNQNQSQFLQ